MRRTSRLRQGNRVSDCDRRSGARGAALQLGAAAEAVVLQREKLFGGLKSVPLFLVLGAAPQDGHKAMGACVSWPGDRLDSVYTGDETDRSCDSVCGGGGLQAATSTCAAGVVLRARRSSQGGREVAASGPDGARRPHEHRVSSWSSEHRIPSSAPHIRPREFIDGRLDQASGRLDQAGILSHSGACFLFRPAGAFLPTDLHALHVRVLLASHLGLRLELSNSQRGLSCGGTQA